MKAEIIAVGSELLTPDRLDTNSLFLTEELNKLGVEVLRSATTANYWPKPSAMPSIACRW
jgi:molybdopterin-biosynthesis enzyme MoeA-like protein